jgi:hypothetical protein
MRQDIFVFCWCRSNLNGVFDKLTYDESTVENRTGLSISFSKNHIFKNDGGASIFFELKIISISVIFWARTNSYTLFDRFNYVESNAKYRLTWH